MKPRKPIKRRKRPGAKQPDIHGNHRQRVKALNELWRRIIYTYEPSGVCPMCHKRPHGQAAHIFAKGSAPAARFELDGGIPLCVPCHRRFDSDHELHQDFAVRYIGRTRYQRLYLRAYGRGKADHSAIRLELEREAQRRGIEFEGQRWWSRA